MPKVIRRYLPWIIMGIIFYILLSYHFIFVGKSIKLLKKSRLTMEYTIYSISGKKNATIMAIKSLRQDDIGRLLIRLGKMSQSEYETLMSKYGE